MLSERVLDFHELRQELEDQACAAKGWARVGDEKTKKATKEASWVCSKLHQALNKTGVLKGRVAFERVVANMQQERVIELEELEAAQKDVEQRFEAIETRMGDYKAKLQTIEGYTAFEAFEEEMVEGSTSAFIMDLDLYKVQVARLFPKVNISCLNPKESEDEAKEDGKNVSTTSESCTR